MRFLGLGKIKDVHWDRRLSTESHMAKKPHEGQKGQLTKVIINLLLSASQKAHAVISR